MPDANLPDLTVLARSDMESILAEYALAHRALRWLIEHRVYWCRRQQALVDVSSHRPPLCEPPVEVLAYIHGVGREADLEAVHAG